MTPNEVAGANSGLRYWFVEKSLVVLSPWPGVARLDRSAKRMMRLIVMLMLAVVSCRGAASNEVAPGDDELSRRINKLPTMKSYKWELESAELVGTNLYYLAKKETYIDPVPRVFHGDTHWSSEPTEYALLKYSIAPGAKTQKPGACIPLGRFENLTRRFTLLPGATNILVRKSSGRPLWQVSYECWSLSPTGGAIHSSSPISVPKGYRHRVVSGFLGAGYKNALFSMSNTVVCLNLPDLSTNTMLPAAEVLQAYLDSLATNVDVFSTKIAGDLGYLITSQETPGPQRETVILNLRGMEAAERQEWRHGTVNVLDHELLFLDRRDPGKPNVSIDIHAIVSRDRKVRASLEQFNGRDISWPIGSPVVVFSLDAKDMGRKVSLLVWNFENGERWPVNIGIPDKLSN